jgi:hypothetical protein
MQEIIDKYLSIDQRYIKPIRLSDRDVFYKILSCWSMLNKSEDSRIGKSDYGGSAHLKLEIGNRKYYLNSDTNGRGVREFLKNRGNNWRVIQNANGFANVVTNKLDETSIPGFYFYKKTGL